MDPCATKGTFVVEKISLAILNLKNIERYIFVNELVSLIDIAYADALTMIKIQVDRQLWKIIPTRERKIIMNMEDKAFTEKQERYRKREKEPEERRCK